MDTEKSRKKTPWDGENGLTSTQEFLKQHYERYYADRHRLVSESGEADMINSFTPAKCPYCSSEKFKKSGLTKSGATVYVPLWEDVSANLRNHL